jgi:hypothetical protein
MYYLARRHQPHLTFLVRSETPVQISIIAMKTLSMVHPTTGELHDVPSERWGSIADVVERVRAAGHGRVALTPGEIARVVGAA